MRTRVSVASTTLRAALLGGLWALLGCLPAQEAAAQGSRPLVAAKQRYEERDQGTRIIGGDDTTYARNPWQVALVYAEDKEDPLRAQFCGGVIIHPRWVLTAAHCIDGGTQARQVDVISGTRFLKEGAGHRVEVEAVEYHDQWNNQTKDFDIGLVRVKTPLKGRSIRPADAAALQPAVKIWVSGWGATERSSGTTTLQGVELDYITTQDCNGPLSYSGAVSDNMFCAGRGGGDGGGGIDSCQGDSGGPASIGIPPKAALVGLVSWGEYCAVPYKYGVYTKLSNFIDWVRQKTKGEVKW